jgi:hypothetical protein
VHRADSSKSKCRAALHPNIRNARCLPVHLGPYTAYICSMCTGVHAHGMLYCRNSVAQTQIAGSSSARAAPPQAAQSSLPCPSAAAAPAQPWAQSDCASPRSQPADMPSQRYAAQHQSRGGIVMKQMQLAPTGYRSQSWHMHACQARLIPEGELIDSLSTGLHPREAKTFQM